ncbi:reverse transcriptase domain-containing protein [Tanacetum coccineum]
MSMHSGSSPTAPTFVVRNTIGREKEISQGNLNGPQEKLKAVKARLNFEEVSQHSESGTPGRRRDLRKRLGSTRICSVSESPEPRRGRSESPRKRDQERKTVFKRLEKGVFHRLGDKEKSISAYSNDSRRQSTEALSKSEGNAGGHWKSRSKKQRSSIDDDDLSQPWVCEKTDPFTPRIYYFDLPKRTRMPGHVKTYDGSEDPEDHLKIFQAAAKVECWAMPTWCHMFNSTLTGSARVWFDDLPPESVDSNDDLKEAFLENFLQQKKCIKDHVEIHHFKQREGESTEDFVRRFKIESMDVKGAPEIMRISGFMHGITNPELIKRLQDKISKYVDKMMRQEAGHKQKFKKGGFKNQQRSERRHDRFTLLSKYPKEILALEKEKFKAPPPMTTPVEKRNGNKFCEFHGEVGHNTNGCMHLKKQIEELLKNGKLSHVIKELKQNSGKDQPKTNKKGEASNKDKALAILMVQSWQRVARQRITQSFSSDPEISFLPLEEEEGSEGPMIIEAKIGGHFIHRLYVDGGSALEILYEHCFNRLRPKIKNQMVPATAPLIGFSGEIIWPLGKISLLVKIGGEEHLTSAWMNFVIVRSSSPYNGIIGRPGVRKIQEVLSTAHGMLKFPVAGGIFTLKSIKIIPIKCAAVSGPEGQPSAVNQAVEERIKVAINLEYPEQTIMIGSTLTKEGRNKLCDLLQRNLYAKKRGQAADRNQAIQEEVEKLVDAGIMKEVHYHSWLSNPVMVKKHDGSWRMCVDFKDLNKACPKDGYPLPEIDWKVESLYGFPFKCFLDAYKGYHQIKMTKEDEEKTTFITSQGIFCYSKMPFSLRNVGATYQRLVDKAFHKQIGRNLEVYVDDLVIKSRTKDEIIRYIKETFKTLKDINMKLNPKKCTFGVEEGMFLGYKVNNKGIKVCPDKANAVLSLSSLKCLKNVQKLNGKLVNLNRVLAKSAEKSLLFFKTLKKCTKKSDFHWTKEAESSFKQMKQLIAKLPMLTVPKEKEELIVYLAAAKEAVSPEVNYTSMEKLVLALVHAGKRLKRYFQAHPIIVVTDQPIKQVLSKPEVAGRLQKWSIKLGEYAIHYRPRVSGKGQILADFIVERPEEDSMDTPMEIKEEPPEQWILFTDGSSCADSSGAGLILTNPEGT